MKKFIVQYKVPLAALDSWMQVQDEEKKKEEAKMMGDWQKWMSEHKENILESFGAGKTKWVDTTGIKDFRNEIMVLSLVQGESKEAVAEMFKNHPHLQIPTSWIEISELRQM